MNVVPHPDGPDLRHAWADRPDPIEASDDLDREHEDWLDAVPGRRERVQLTNDIFMAAEALLAGLSDDERRRVGATLYLDGDGVVRARRQQLRAAPSRDDT